jgi:hypothetical protein
MNDTFPVPNKNPFDFNIARYPDLPFEDPENTLAMDWESYYDKEYSLTNMSTIAYVMDERFDPYLISAYGKVAGQDIKFVGRPNTFPWADLIAAHKARPIRFVAHNASFDEPVTWRYLASQGIAGLEWLVDNFQFLCTADMGAALKYPRALAGLAYQLGFPPLDKAVRDEMKGVDFSIEANLTNKVKNYALYDSKACFMAWEKLQDQWPEEERQFAMRSRRRCYRGIPINTAALEEGMKVLGEIKEQSGDAVPWDWRKTHKTPLAFSAMEAQCAKDEIPIPVSFAEKDEDCMEWEAMCEKKGITWINDARNWRKANTHLKRLDRMRESVQSFDLSDMMHFQIKYCGAHTGRSSGTGGFNMQNLPSGKVLDRVNIRNMFVAPPGYKIVIIDYDQLEPRITYLVTRMLHTLAMIRNGTHVYEVEARQHLGYNDPRPIKQAVAENPELYKSLYALAKARIISLNYGTGPATFRIMAGWFGLNFTEEEAAQVVWAFRDQNPQITSHWAEHQEWLEISARNQDPEYSFKLLSGREFKVFNPTYIKDEETGRINLKVRRNRGDSFTFARGALLLENEVQATGMDILKYAVTNLSQELVNHLVLDTHDELVFCLPEKNLDALVEEAVATMTNIPWLPSDFPLEAGADIVDKYDKL